MKCPHCDTINRDERESCYHCDADLRPLRQVVIHSKHLYNEALERAERGHDDIAIDCLEKAVECDATFANAWLVLGTLYARAEREEDARNAWEHALKISPTSAKACEYLERLERVETELPRVERLKSWVYGMGIANLLLVLLAVFFVSEVPAVRQFFSALTGAGTTSGSGRVVSLILMSVPIIVALALRYSGTLSQLVSDLSGRTK